jgi:hypothetical protein
MNQAFLMRVLYRVADLDEQIKATAESEVVLIAELDNGDAFDQLHNEVRPAGFGRAAVQDARDARMVHHRQGLTLGFETSDDLPRVHAEFDDLQGDASSDGLFLLGHENDTEPTFADLLKKLVTSDDCPRFLMD